MGVLLAHVVAPKKQGPPTEPYGRSVAESRPGGPDPQAVPLDVREVGVPGNRPEREHDAHTREGGQLEVEKAAAAGELVRTRPVGRRGASQGREDEHPSEPQAVVAGGARRLVCEAGPMKSGVEEVARAVSREHPPGAIGPVRGGREANDAEARIGVAEAGNGAAPVLPVEERTALVTCDLLAPGDEPRARTAGGDFPGQNGQGRHVGPVRSTIALTRGRETRLAAPMKARSLFGLGAGLLGLGLVVSSCDELGQASTGGLARAGCPELGGGAMGADFSSDAKASATIRAFVLASGDLSNVAQQAEAAVAGACTRMGADLGVPLEQMQPRDQSAGARVNAACGAVDARIAAILQQGAGVQLRTTYTPPQCNVQANAYAQCAAQCNVNVDPGYIIATCQPGHLSGTCDGTCSGECDGSCHGSCSGACSSRNAQGQCDGQCSGTCQGRCDATCHASCQGTWRAPHCDVDARAPQAEAKCAASCKAHAEVTAQCSPPQVSVVATANVGDFPRLVATLNANLPTLIMTEVAYGRRIGADVDALVQVGADLPQVLGEASAHAIACMAASAEAVASARASLTVSVQASVSISGKAGATAG